LSRGRLGGRSDPAHGELRAVAVVSFPQRRRPSLPDLARLAPSVRSLAVGAALLAVAALLYVLARETPMFAIRRIEVAGVPAPLAAKVRRALAPVEGRSLLVLRPIDVRRRLVSLPEVRSATYDRAFPHTLRLTVVPERPVAVVRRGAGSWLVSARGRILRPLPRGTLARLPRVWLPREVDVTPGTTLAADEGGQAAAAVALAGRSGFGARIRNVGLAAGELDLELASGLELRLGEPRELALKLAVAGRILPLLGEGATYLDVSVPARPVASAEPQAGG
jgi:cell division protein FtsQ